MARFDVDVNTGSHASTSPYLLDVQRDLLAGLDSRMVVPLRHLAQLPKVKLPSQLMPVFNIEDADCLMETPKMSAAPQRILKLAVISFAASHNQISAALDLLCQGY